MLKCAIFVNFLDFENGCCYLNTIADKRRKSIQASCILFKNKHHLIDLNAFLSYIWAIMGEKITLKCAIFADFLDFENCCCYLNTIACKRRKNTRVSFIFVLEHTSLY